MQERVAGLDDLALLEAEFPGDGAVRPEAEPLSVRHEVEEEQQRDLFEREFVEALAEAVIDPGEVGGQGAYSRGVDGRTLGEAMRTPRGAGGVGRRSGRAGGFCDGLLRIGAHGVKWNTGGV